MTSIVRSFMSFFALALVIAAPAFSQSKPPAQQPAPPASSAPDAPPGAAATAATPSYQITGSARSGKTPLPGATVTASNTLTGKKYAAVTNLEGKFELSGIPRGRYVVRIEFIGFALFSQDVVLNPENPAAKLDAELLLASRQQQQASDAGALIAAAGRGFQNIAVDSALSSLAGGNAGLGGTASFSGATGQNADLSSLPLNGAGAEGPTESVSITGAQGRTQDFGAGSEEDLQERIQEFRDRMQREGVALGGQGQGRGGGAGGGSGPGGIGGAMPIVIGRFGGRGGFNINQPHGVLYYSNDNALFDAAPFSLTGAPSAKTQYNQARFGVNVGGPLNIPKIFNGGAKWFFFAGWNGSRGSSPYESFSTVPTADERNGNFSAATYNNGSPVQIFNPATGQQFQFGGVLNVIDPSSISPAAKSLLQYIPLPNIPSTASGQNFEYLTNTASSSDAVILRLVHNFSSTGPGFGPFGGGGRGGARRSNNLNFGLNWSRTSVNIPGAFPSLAGGTGTQGLNASAGWVYGKNRVTNNLRFGYNHNHVSTTNLYSDVLNVAGAAGITGISSAPFDWGLPQINFTSFGALANPTPRRELDQTYTISDTISWNHKKHNFRFGGDYRRILQSFHSARNAEGSFIFTGFATSQYTSGSSLAVPDTGYDFADFLLGFPQQTSLQFGANSYDFRENSFDLFAQDDWRIAAKLTLNIGVRYEYNGPFTEAQDRISNLVVGPGFSSAVPIVPAGAVLPPNAGTFLTSPNPSLLNPDRNDFAPRIGIAWRPLSRTVVRAGYGINYNLAQYSIMVQNFAFQPPFAQTSTNTTDIAALATAPLTLVNGFPSVAAGTVTNNFAVDPNYALGYVQIWNLDLQRELPGNVVLNAGYNGAKGTRLDTERALVAGGQPFIYESSEGNSVLHAASVRIRKRMSRGFGAGAQYIFSKSLDDASSIGGGATLVAQNPFDISADRGLSNFDQTHKLTGNWIFDLPFGEDRALAKKGFWSHALGNWQWSGDFSISSGFYYSPHVLGGALDIGRGVSGSLRANVVPGQAIGVANRSALEWFNTAAFCAPGINCVNPSGSAFGDAGRNIIEGPGAITFDMSLNRTIPIRESRSLDLRVAANNVFNHVNYASINTVVNSLTYGQVTSAGGMRRLTLQARFRF